MGLTANSMGAALLGESLRAIRKTEQDITVALAGNPNVGKSTVFNALTGLHQHTGNWPGKTVATAQGQYMFQAVRHIVVDLPGTYSLEANSTEEEIARDFICFGSPDITVVVTDATCLERNLNLVLQILEITPRVIVCVNLLDEAEKRRITVDLDTLSDLLGVPVVGTAAGSGKGLEELKACIFRRAREPATTMPHELIYPEALERAIAECLPSAEEATAGGLSPRRTALQLLTAEGQTESKAVTQARGNLQQQGIDAARLRDMVAETRVAQAETLARRVTFCRNRDYDAVSRRLDCVLTSKRYGIPIMIALLGVILWLTVSGANFPSAMLSACFGAIGERLETILQWCRAPKWLEEILVQGVYRTLSWVVAVMLPPMAIFFPLFTILEDLGYLPRVAFNLDNFFRRANACGKQALSMCMGFGCNAAGVVGCRIIDSPRERLIAVLTNNFVPCNGRFPTLIALISVFFVSSSFGIVQTLSAALFLCIFLLLGVMITLLVSKLLSHTLLRGAPSSFALELPPYRRPQVGQILVRSVFDRTLFVLGRAALISVPAGVLIWCMANVQIGGTSLLNWCSDFLNPIGRLMGMDGVILMAFLLGFPANEIVIPIILMAYTAGGQMTAYDSLADLKLILTENGWTAVTALCTMLFSLMHFPCGTTCMTIHKETGSLKWTLAAILIPTLQGMLTCFLVARCAAWMGIG